MSIITLLTDFGLKDSYVAEMKGVILGLAPNVTIVDISHDIPKYDIREGAYHLARSVPYFPEGTVHVGVVDPGVGGERRPIIIEALDAFFVGPDNGLLAPAAEKKGIIRIYEINKQNLFPERVSNAFHGRDIFSPTGAMLSQGMDPTELGTTLTEYIKLSSFEPKLLRGQVEGRVIHIDDFGNIVTNLTINVLRKTMAKDGCVFAVNIHGDEYRIPYVSHFSAVSKGELLMLVASGGYLEISVNQGNAQELLGVARGDKLNFTPLA